MLSVEGMPPCLTWAWRKKYFSEDIHAEQQFTATVRRLTKLATMAATVRGGIPLAFGLLLREIDRVHLIQTDLEVFPKEGLPSWVHLSPFCIGWKEVLSGPMMAIR
jgi:hypothetical protein